MSMGVMLSNGTSIGFNQAPLLAIDDFLQDVIHSVNRGARLCAYFGMPHRGQIMLITVLCHDAEGRLEVLKSMVGDSYAALTPILPQAHWFERELAEQWGIKPTDHPWLKPIRFHSSYRDGYDAWDRITGRPIEPGVTDYFRVDGDEIHEVAVGPVHAGIIEPGHFRFQCQGENVLHLEIELGYQHRGIEQALVGGPGLKDRHWVECAAGDTTVGHTTAWAMNLEALAGVDCPEKAQYWRAVALELERLANHTGDLGAIAGDVGFLPTASFCGRLRGDFLNITAMLCGNRFGRNMVIPGGVGYDLSAEKITELLNKLQDTYDGAAQAIGLLWQCPTVMSRLNDTGKVSNKDALNLGLVGVAARASNVRMDVRRDYPWGAYKLHESPSVIMPQGDVNARASVRWFEMGNSVSFIKRALSAMPTGPVKTPMSTLPPNKLAVSLVEGWRGEICHVAITDNDGKLQHYKMVDPSFHNWFGLAMALRNQQVSDFPLCNKSFNLSYCGHDL